MLRYEPYEETFNRPNVVAAHAAADPDTDPVIDVADQVRHGVEHRRIGVPWTADAPDGLTPTLEPVDGAESDLDRADVLERLTRHRWEAARAWDPYALPSSG